MLLTPYKTTRKLFQHTDLLGGLSGFIKEAELVKLKSFISVRWWNKLMERCDDETDLFQEQVEHDSSLPKSAHMFIRYSLTALRLS